jgi:hypothetical protein
VKIILILTLVCLAGCSSLSMNKACKPVEDSNDKWMCKTVMPWESI